MNVHITSYTASLPLRATLTDLTTQVNPGLAITHSNEPGVYSMRNSKKEIAWVYDASPTQNVRVVAHPQHCKEVQGYLQSNDVLHKVAYISLMVDGADGWNKLGVSYTYVVNILLAYFNKSGKRLNITTTATDTHIKRGTRNSLIQIHIRKTECWQITVTIHHPDVSIRAKMSKLSAEEILSEVEDVIEPLGDILGLSRNTSYMIKSIRTPVRENSYPIIEMVKSYHIHLQELHDSSELDWFSIGELLCDLQEAIARGKSTEELVKIYEEFIA